MQGGSLRDAYVIGFREFEIGPLPHFFHPLYCPVISILYFSSDFCISSVQGTSSQDLLTFPVGRNRLVIHKGLSRIACVLTFITIYRLVISQVDMAEIKDAFMAEWMKPPTKVDVQEWYNTVEASQVSEICLSLALGSWKRSLDVDGLRPMSAI